MAIFHLTTKPISRGAGRSAISAAAYCSGSQLHDQRQGLTFDYSAKVGVVHTMILTPTGAPEWTRTRENLWNCVEEAEKRKDSRIAREIEVALPSELSLSEQIKLVEGYVREQFVGSGLVVDVALHDKGDGNPHAHILATTRPLLPDGTLGKKDREQNTTATLLRWRESWAIAVNEALLKNGIDARIDHRSYADQGVDLIPSIHRGVADHSSEVATDRTQEYFDRARKNGELIIADPRRAFDLLARHQAVFGPDDIYRLAHRCSADEKQYDAVRDAILASPELVVLTDGKYTTSSGLRAEAEMLEAVRQMNAQDTHMVAPHIASQESRLAGLDKQQQSAFDHLLRSGDLACLVGFAGSGKSYLLAAVRRTYEACGYRVHGATLAGIAAQQLQDSSGIPSQTLHRLLGGIERGQVRLGQKNIIVVDEAGLVGTRQMHQLVRYASVAGAKILLVGDHQQLQAVEAGGPFRAILQRVGHCELVSVRRQQEQWMRDSTVDLARGQIRRGLDRYKNARCIMVSDTHVAAMQRLVQHWWADRRRDKTLSQLMLAYTRADVAQLNEYARQHMRAAELLGPEHVIQADTGPLSLSVGDQVMLGRNAYSLGVRNGTIGTVRAIHGDVILIGVEGQGTVAIDTNEYPWIRHGYAVTCHKSQGQTVDRTYALASYHWDRHSTYVALSRHRQAVSLYYGEDQISSYPDLCRLASRNRPKEIVIDYALSRGLDIDDVAISRLLDRERAGEVLASIRRAYPDISSSNLYHVLTSTPAGETVLAKYATGKQLQASVIKLLQAEASAQSKAEQRLESQESAQPTPINPSKPDYPRPGGV